MDIYEILNNVSMEEYEAVNLSEKEKNDMMKKFKKNFKRGHKKYFTLAACIAVVAIMSQTAFAQTIVENIIKSISTGYNNFMQVTMPTQIEIPEEYRGMFFDKDGNSIDEYKLGMAVYDANGNMLITEDGEKIAEYDGEYVIENEDGTSVKVSMGAKRDIIASGSDESKLVVTDESQVAEKLNFAPAMPEYLPVGYEFYGAVFYKDENGAISGDYLAMYYKNPQTGKEFSIHERIINEDTAYEAGTDGEIKQITIKGHKAVIMNGSSIHWEEDEISVAVIGGSSGITTEDIIKIAESTVR